MVADQDPNGEEHHLILSDDQTMKRMIERVIVDDSRREIKKSWRCQ